MAHREHTYRERLELQGGGDDRAPGGAVTVALCGHWEHDGECRWPHLTTVERDGALVDVRVEFDAPAAEVDEVRARIRAALEAGTLTGPDGVVSRWRVVEDARAD